MRKFFRVQLFIYTEGQGKEHEKKNFISIEQPDNGWMYFRNIIRCSQRAGK